MDGGILERIKNFLKNPRFLVPILIYLILLGPTLYLFSASPPETKVQTHKGAWYPIVLPSHFSEMREMGANTVFFRGDSGEGTVAQIQAAHRSGLRVALTTDREGPYLKKVDNDSEYWDSFIIETAKTAEKWGVEFFAPLAEPEGLFEEDTGRWAQEILPKIKEVYHGEIIWRGGDLIDMDFSGYDYIGFTTFMDSNTTAEKYSQALDQKLDQALGFCQRDNCKGVMITEFGSWQDHDPGDILSGIIEITVGEGKHTAQGKEEVEKAYEIVLERGKDKGVVGYFFFNEYPGVSSKFKEVIERWYKEIL
jgi:hypothetical protein